MNPIAARFALILVVVGFFLGIWLGFRWGAISQAVDVERLKGEVAALTLQRDEAAGVAAGNATTVASIRNLMADERRTRLLQQQLAAAELDSRSQRIVQLERQAAKRQQVLNDKVRSDENCNVLRTTPVCAALARGLWGGPAAADAH